MNLAEFREAVSRRITGPIVKVFSKTGLSPNAVTLLGLLVNVAAACVIATGHLFAGGVLVLFSGLFDLIDGALARFSGQTSRFGAFLDSTVDRLSEAVLFLGLLILYVMEGSTLEVLLVFVILVGCFLVSYIRARAEGLGISCRVGLFTRPERVIVLALGLLLNQVFIILWVLLAFTYVTVAQRLFYVWQRTKVD